MKKIMNSISIKTILIITIIILPINILMLFQAEEASKVVLNKAHSSVENIVAVLENSMHERMDKTESILGYLLLNDADCIEMKNQPKDNYEYDSAKYRFYQTLKSMTTIIDGADGYFYYMKNKQDGLYHYHKYENKMMRDEIENYITSNYDEREFWGWNFVTFSEGNYYFLILNLKNIAYGGWINLQTLEKEILKSLPYQSVKLDFKKQSERFSENEWLSIDVQNHEVFCNVQVNKDEIFENVTLKEKIIGLISILYLVLIPVLYLFLRNILIVPLKKLCFAHAELTRNNQKYRIKEKANSSEYRELYNSFNEMADTLEYLRIESYEKEIDKQKIEIENLQLQIRPHFLQNTFNLLFNLAQRKENDAIQDIILYLSDYFRYIFREKKELELFYKEKRMIDAYVGVASVRYEGRVSLEWKLNPEIDYVRVPPLLLHNFVENAVKHGIKDSIPLLITMEGYYQDGKVTFLISDNGNGIPEGKVLKIREMLNGNITDSGESIGLKNSLRRLKYFYGSEAKIEVESVENESTSFMVIMPYDLEESDESTNCE